MASDDIPIRAWVAKCQFAGARKPFWFGTVFMRLGAPYPEIEAEVLKSISDIIPDSFPRPDIIKLEPGILIFHPAKPEDI